VNRRARRAAGLHRATSMARCPDCDSTVEVEQLSQRVYNAVVRHDDTCPWLADFERRGGYGIRLYRREGTP
jgi:hypothetical protein